jgi:hypothetical protein
MFTELKNIISDIQTGAIPANELPGFLGYLLRKVAWLCLMVIIAFAISFLWAK